MKVLRLVLSSILGFGLTFAVQWWDRRRLDARQREQAWNTASWGSALYGFSVFSMIGWVWVTRQRFSHWWREDGPLAIVYSVLLLAAGVVAALVILAAIVGVDMLVAGLAGLPD